MLITYVTRTSGKLNVIYCCGFGHLSPSCHLFLLWSVAQLMSQCVKNVGQICQKNVLQNAPGWLWKFWNYPNIMNNRGYSMVPAENADLWISVHFSNSNKRGNTDLQSKLIPALYTAAAQQCVQMYLDDHPPIFIWINKWSTHDQLHSFSYNLWGNMVSISRLLM